MSNPAGDHAPESGGFWGEAEGLIGPLGVVFGDIGTSPLYAMTEVALAAGLFTKLTGTARDDAIIGLTSLFFWSLIVLTIKYVVLIMQADQKGEGGIFVLLSLLTGRNLPAWAWWLRQLIRIGAALLVADGVITPAISVLSAEEGLAVRWPELTPWIVPLSAVTLLGLFSIQQFGTDLIGRIMGPIMLVWFITIAALGLGPIIEHPVVFHAINPVHGFNYLAHHGFDSLHVLGGVVLCITGGEAMYADMGHFSRDRVRKAWFFIVLPCLLLNYFGQAGRMLDAEPIPATVLADGEQVHNIFYSLVPQNDVAMIAMIILATLATIIASQALISGTFSLVQQAINLRVVPALPIKHTNREHHGQIYIPIINWLLCFGCVALVFFFKKSTAMAAAYGIAVTGTMAISTMAFYAVSVGIFRWNWFLMLLVCGALIVFDLMFFGANLIKFLHGGYVPIAIAAVLFLIMEDWIWGRGKESEAHQKFANRKVNYLIQQKDAARRDGGGGPRPVETYRAVAYLCSRAIDSAKDMVPPAALAHMRRNGILPRHIAFINFKQLDDEPYYDGPRFELREFGKGIVSLTGYYGFMEDPDLDAAMAFVADRQGISPEVWSFEAGEPEFFIREDSPWWLQWAGTRYKAWFHLAVPAHQRFAGSSKARSRISRTVVPVEIWYDKEAGDARFDVVLDNMLVAGGDDGGDTDPVSRSGL